MALEPTFSRLPGEQDFLSVSRSEGNDGVALSYPVDEDGAPIRCGFYITNYRIVITPCPGTVFRIPHLSLDSWEVEKHVLNATQRASFPQPPISAPGGGSGSAGAAVPSAPTAFTLTMTTKYLWTYKVMFQDERQATAARKLIDNLRPTHLNKMPAFELFAALPVENIDATDVSQSPWVNFGWNLYHCERELHRQLCRDPASPAPVLTESDDCKCGPGMDLRHWFRATTMGQEDNMYGRSPTYPFQIAVPNSVSDATLVDCVYARSRGRIPAISFVHFGSGAVLARCSQPISKGDLRRDSDVCLALINSGYSLKNVRPRESRPLDPAASALPSATVRSVAPPPSLIETTSSSLSTPSPTSATPQLGAAAPSKRGGRTLMVADCRPYAAAYGNQTMGGGFESGPTHDFCKVKFHGIDNIHGVTKAFQKLKALIHGYNGKFPKENFYEQLHDSQWLYHIQRVLMCATEIAEGLERGDSFLVHCTDGWDRTSQCTSIPMLLLDPFYRTTVGFCLLIEKEFCAFGHKFAERCNHQVQGDTFYTSESGVSSSDTESHQVQQVHKLQPSPIFVQWLDCVFQIVRQFPNQFEFTTKLLEFLADEVYSCMYGTFLGNSDKERTFEGVKLRTASLWTKLIEMVQSEKDGDAPIRFLNTFYDAENAWRYISKAERNGMDLLRVSASSKRLVFWEEHYLKFDSDLFTLRVTDHEANFASVATRKKTAPFYCAELEQYLAKLVDEAKAERLADIPRMQELLTRLQVQRPPPVSSQQQAHASKSGPVDTKTCSQCHEKFGFFAAKEYCCACAVKAPLCSRCIRTRNGKKYCPSCMLMSEMADDE